MKDPLHAAVHYTAKVARIAMALWFVIWAAAFAYGAWWIFTADPTNWFTVLIALWPLYHAGRFGLKACDLYLGQQREVRPDERQRYLESRFLYVPKPRQDKQKREDE